MRNMSVKFVKILDICKKFSNNLVNESGNLPRRGVIPVFLTSKSSHLVSLPRNTVSIASPCSSPIWKNARQTF